MSNNPLVSVLILNWNGVKYTGKCILSLLNDNMYKPIEIIVADNGSTDGSLQQLRELARYKIIKLIENGVNDGFAKGYNPAVTQAQGQFIYLLNNDAFVFPNTISTMVQVLNTDNKIAVVGTPAYDPESKKRYYGVGGWIRRDDRLEKVDGWGKYWTDSDWGLIQEPCHYCGNSQVRKQNEEIMCIRCGHNYSKDKIIDCDYVGFGNAMIRVSAWDNLSTGRKIPEEYFIYKEDVDCCLQFKKEGYRVVHTNDSGVFHFVSVSTIKRDNNKYWKIAFESHQIFVNKWKEDIDNNIV